MFSERRAEGLVVDREWIRAQFGLSPEWTRKNLDVFEYDRGVALHLVTPEVARRLGRTRPRRRVRKSP